DRDGQPQRAFSDARLDEERYGFSANWSNKSPVKSRERAGGSSVYNRLYRLNNRLRIRTLLYDDAWLLGSCPGLLSAPSFSHGCLNPVAAYEFEAHPFL